MIRLLSDIDGWELWLYGYGGEYPDDFGDARVHIMGLFTAKDEPSIWENTDLLLFPSQWRETFGFSVLEALAHDVPVLCSDIAGAACFFRVFNER